MDLIKSIPYLALSSLFLFSAFLHGQDVSFADVPFYKLNGDQLENPFSGGIRAPQLNMIDLNFDGLDDLLLFDRAGNVYNSFIATDSNSVNYIHDNSWIQHFPQSQIWIRLVDFNQDGILDLFSFPESSGLPGVQVHRGVINDGLYDFELMQFPNERSDILYYPISNGKTQVYVSVIDIPVIKDVDGDGDVDILSFDPGATTVNYYRNMALEQFDNIDTLDFIEEDGCYGRFIESGFSQDVLLSSDGVGCGNNLVDDKINTRHAGSTIELFDADGNGVNDILLGDASYNGLNFLYNGGTQEEAWMTSSSFDFPEEEPVEIELFLTPYVLDIDNDEIDELLVVSNDPRTSQTLENFWYYENIDTIGLSPLLINKDFLKGSMVDLGESAEPTFCDYNADGLLDIVIGTSGNFILTSEREPSLILFKNIGTAESPEYVLEDDNYLNFNEFKTTSTFLAPAFGDLDGDGDQDLLVGDNVGKLYYAENIAGEGEPFEFDNPSYEYQDIRVSGYLRPTIFDLNDDGLGDIIAGERNFNSTDEVPIASINYFENQGSIGVPSFDPNVNTFPNNPALGGINLKQQNSISNNSSISVWNDEKDILFFTGSESGDVRLFSLPKDSSIHSIYTEVFDYELDQIDVGEESSVKVNDLNGDNELEILVGNYRGGIGIFNTLTPIIANTIVDNTEEVILGKSFQIFPNPTYDIIQIRSEELTFDRAEIYDISGRKRLTSNTEMMNLSNLESGSYIVRLYTAKGLAVKKITKL